MKFIVAPSILAADFSKLKEEIKKIENLQESWVHLDIMDNHFVPNLTFGPCIVKGIRKLTKLFFDAHLMVENPEKLIDSFTKIPVQLITFHLEETNYPYRLISQIRSNNIKVGISVNPSTPIEIAYPLLKYVDLLLIMSVEPGFSGQKFIDNTYAKIKEADNFRRKNNLNFLIEVDGGINDKNIENIIKFGANVIVLGSFFFENEYKVIKKIITKARE